MKVDNKFIIETAKEYYKIYKRVIQCKEKFEYKNINNFNGYLFGSLIHKILYNNYLNEIKNDIINIFEIPKYDLYLINKIEEYVYTLPSYQHFILIQPCKNNEEVKMIHFYLNEFLRKKNKSNYYYKLNEIINDNIIDIDYLNKNLIIKDIKHYLKENNFIIPKYYIIYNHLNIRKLLDDIYYNNCYKDLKNNIDELLKKTTNYNEYINEINKNLIDIDIFFY